MRGKPVKKSKKEQLEKKDKNQENTLFWKPNGENVRRRQLSFSNTADKLNKMRTETRPLI